MAGTARSFREDPFSTFRFRIEDTNGFISGGFQSCSAPEHMINEIDYSEGNQTYTKVYPGRSTFTPIVLARGVFLGSSELARWMRSCAEGRNYRTNLRIHQVHRTEALGLVNYSQVNASRVIEVYHCIPIRFRVGTDMDAMASEILIEEIELKYEYFRIKLNGNEVK